MTKYKKYPWPTDAATIKYVDKKIDQLANRLTRMEERRGRITTRFKDRLSALEALLAPLDDEE